MQGWGPCSKHTGHNSCDAEGHNLFILPESKPFSPLGRFSWGIGKGRGVGDMQSTVGTSEEHHLATVEQ